MRLINTTTFQLEDFGGTAPAYAILSHTWGEEEVLYEDVNKKSSSQKKGYSKISKSCQIAATEGFTHAWIDTCCIDKSSSAELSEAINSMFNWYRDSRKCYVYLEDLKVSKRRNKVYDISDCRWFTGGWTLQELIAPLHVHFYSHSWEYCGTKNSLLHQLRYITQIDPEALSDKTNTESSPDLSQFSIAKRMSWAARRQTTRPEDGAYCLMGLFGINMPLLYGEGLTNAFIRLQEEIMKTSMDQSMFAWKSVQHEEGFGVLATTPTAFRDSSNIAPIDVNDEPFEMTNKGLRMHLKTYPSPNAEDQSIVGILSCRRERDFSGALGLSLLPSSTKGAKNVYFRQGITPVEVPIDKWQSAEIRTIYLARSYSSPSRLNNLTSLWIKPVYRTGALDSMIRLSPSLRSNNSARWYRETRVLQLPGQSFYQYEFWANLPQGTGCRFTIGVWLPAAGPAVVRLYPEYGNDASTITRFTDSVTDSVTDYVEVELFHTKEGNIRKHKSSVRINISTEPKRIMDEYVYEVHLFFEQLVTPPDSSPGPSILSDWSVIIPQKCLEKE